MDASQIIRGLYQGGRPPEGLAVTQAGFDVLVLCACSYQPPAMMFPGVRVVHCPLRDQFREPLSRRDWQNIFRAAKINTRSIQRGRNVLITCQVGLNRSAVVSVTTLVLLLGCSGATGIALVKAARPGSLFNKTFIEQLLWLGA